MSSGSVRSFVLTLLVVSSLLISASAVAVASHYDESDYEDGASDFRIHTYGGSPAEQRQPGAADRSYWTESITYGIPEDEKVYLTKTVTYRPVPSDCAAEDTEEFGVDRDNTYEGERRIDESATESVKSFGKEADVRDRYESEYGQYGTLTTTDYQYVERLRVDWYAPDDFGAPLEIYYGDRFVSAQNGCLDNPDVAGWYRFASVNEGEFENGTEVRQEVPTFSHWFYICDCANRQEAVETLGPPPSEEQAATPTPTETASGAATPTATDGGESGDDGPETDGEADGGQSSTDDGAERPAGNGAGPPPETSGTPGSDPTATATGTRATEAPAGPTTPTPGWDDRVLDTPTAADGAGFTPAVALVALVAVAVAWRRR